MEENQQKVQAYCMELLDRRGITIEAIAELAYWLQKPYLKSLTPEDCIVSVERILSKCEVQYAVITGLTLDIACEEKRLPEVLQDAIANDAPLYGVDEVFGMAIASIYGTIGVTNYGYLDKIKQGLIGELDCDDIHVHTFADDVVGAVAAASAAQLAHNIIEE